MYMTDGKIEMMNGFKLSGLYLNEHENNYYQKIR